MWRDIWKKPNKSNSPSWYESFTHALKTTFCKECPMIPDNFTSLDEVTKALQHAGLESCNLIIGIDFTKSNEWTGTASFNRRSLHHIGDAMNPYEKAISIIGKTLTGFDEDKLIPCYGFGDATTHDENVFSFYPGERACNGFEEILTRYREIVPNVHLSGPTSFAPLIETAMRIVHQKGGQYHVLLIIADGQVTRSVDTERDKLSSEERKTVNAIVAASKYALSIVLVGVGDGPWEVMKKFDDNIPARRFDNFQFVNFTEIMAKNTHHARKEAEFALSALMEIPFQYKATVDLRLLRRRKGIAPGKVALPPPPPPVSSQVSSNTSFHNSIGFQPNPYSLIDNFSGPGAVPVTNQVSSHTSYPNSTGFQADPFSLNHLSGPDTIPVFDRVTSSTSSPQPTGFQPDPFSLNHLSSPGTIPVSDRVTSSTSSPQRIGFQPDPFSLNHLSSPGKIPVSDRVTSSTSSPQPTGFHLPDLISLSDNPSDPGTAPVYDNQLVCPICSRNIKIMALGCGHQTCVACGNHAQKCPICERTIQTRIVLLS